MSPMKLSEPRICPPGCPRLNDGADPWGCDYCRKAEDDEQRRLFEEEKKREARDEN